MDWSRVDCPDTSVFQKLRKRTADHWTFLYASYDIGQSQRKQLRALGYIQ